MRRILSIYCSVCLFLCSAVMGQDETMELKWEQTHKRTVLVISCDAKNVPIYVDGEFVGNSPLTGPVDVLPGWHRVSYFPDLRQEGQLAVSVNRRVRDIMRLGQQDVFVEEGDSSKVTLSYRNIEAEVEDYDRKRRSGKAVGFLMMILFLGLIGWAMT